MGRKDEIWQNRSGGYIDMGAGGYNVLVNGVDRYLNFGILSGITGYGIRDNAGVMEVKNSSGSWVSLSTGSVGPGTINEIAYFDTTTTVDSLPVATYPSLAELANVKGVTSAIQTQINGKQATMGADDNYVTDAEKSALHGVNDANTTSNSYADGKVDDTVYGIGRDNDTTHAPSKNAVYDKIQSMGASGGANVKRMLIQSM